MILRDRDGKSRCEIADPAKALLMSTKHYRLYLASTTDPPATDSRIHDPADHTDLAECIPTDPTSTPVEPRSVLLRLASEQTENGVINVEAELLKRMQATSDEIEEIVRTSGGAPIHYDWLFPQLAATFITEQSQDGRQANLLSFPDIAASELFPLPKLQDYCMIDCKTAAWILGRCFKLQAFLGILGRPVRIHPSQFLISPSRHRLIYIGFISTPLDAPRPATKNLVKCNTVIMTENILRWIEPGQLQQEPEFHQLLRDFAQHDRKDDAMAHYELYTWIGEKWGIKYHPFTYFVKSEQVWKHDNSPIL